MRITAAVGIAALFAPALSHAFDIEGQDGGANLLEAELAFKLDKIDLDNPKRRFTTISMGYAGANGEYDQYMNAGGYNYLEHNKINLRVGYLRFIRHVYFMESLEMDWGLGLAHSSYQLTGSALGLETYLEDKAVGLHGQVGIAYHLTPMIAFEGNLGIYTFPGGNSSSLIDPQILFSFSPTETVRMYAGFRGWNHYIYFEDRRVDIRSTLSGLAAGVTLSF